MCPPFLSPPPLTLLILFFIFQWVGSPCGLHGPYIFYKAFQFHLEGRPRILSLGDFFFVRCKPEDPMCVAELQLLWEERASRQLLSSSKLYFLPEDTPQGRSSDHGEVVNTNLFGGGGVCVYWGGGECGCRGGVCVCVGLLLWIVCTPPPRAPACHVY